MDQPASATPDPGLAQRPLPLQGCRVVERAGSVAGAYAGRLLATLGADVVMLEPAGGSPLRSLPPMLPGDGGSALFAYLGAGKRSLQAALDDPRVEALLGEADILIDDTPLAQRESEGWSEQQLGQRHPRLVAVSVLPFGAQGPKAAWRGEEINLVHASGEGFLLPNGLSHQMFPERPPLKIYGHFASYQGGCVAALAALAAWWAKPEHGGQRVDVSVQDAMLLCGAFALQRLGDGSLEHRSTRSFRYGGVFRARDGYVELLTLEDRQWQGLVQLLGEPDWARDEALRDSLERSRRGDEINAHIREWMLVHDCESIVARAQALGVPAAKYRTPTDVLGGAHEAARGLFATRHTADGRPYQVLVAPYQFRLSPLRLDPAGEAVARHEGANA
ncbi:CoA transferase [Luteimonas sp. SDU82]|uniref:CoA transferase n=1 Tax=Luteimonas sp. SDU82 TaxID=3422592 RepID=UPI003EBEE574